MINSIRKIVLCSRVPQKEDISARISSQIGQAIHNGLEQAWQAPQEALRNLGYPEKLIERIRVNPTQALNSKEYIDIYTERRKERDIAGMTVSGCADMIIENTLHDYKTTSLFAFKNQSNFHKFQLQLSIYRWLHQDVVTNSVGYIHYYIRNFNAYQDSNAGVKLVNGVNTEVPTQEISLLSHEEVERYLTQKITDIIKYKDADEKDLPFCTPKELWQDPPKYQYFASVTAEKATKNFDKESDAMSHLYSRGKGIVKIKSGQVNACRYCNARDICTQASDLQHQGLL